MKLSRREFIALTSTLTVGAAIAPSIALASPTVISSLPTVINSPGQYVLNSNHSMNLSSGAAIRVLANDVTIDLQGYSISNSAAGVSTAAVGVYAENQSHVTVRNGTLEGFHSGAMLQGNIVGYGCIAEDLTITNCTASGILISGTAGVVRRNTISSSLRSTKFCSLSSNTGILGIALALAPKSQVFDNSITFTNTGVSDFAVAFYAGDSCDEVIFLNNSITNATWGIVIDEALLATGELRNTTTTNVGYKSAGGVDLDLL